MKHLPITLIILDGFGTCDQTLKGPINETTAPFFFSLLKKYPHTNLKAAGRSVGLEEGYIGNSEVGHLTIGTGSIIKQTITIINEQIKNESFFCNEILTQKLNELHLQSDTLHIMGIASDAGVHGHIDHLHAYFLIAQKIGIKNIWLHFFMDGRDTPQQSGLDFIKKYPRALIGSLHGRFYAMDRDNNDERTQMSINTLTNQTTISFDPFDYLTKAYQANMSDEFISPILCNPHARIKKGDGIIFANIRPERSRQLLRELQKTEPLFCITPIEYEAQLRTIPLFKKPVIIQYLKQWLTQKKYSLLTIAESEKWAHVTYFFNGYHNTINPRETCIKIASIKAHDYINHPEMSAEKITDAYINAHTKQAYDFCLINYANADMVGHSGNFDATKKAISCVDTQIKRLYEYIMSQTQGILLITADHGNAEMLTMQNRKTSHTTSDVPFIYISSQQKTMPRLPRQLSEIRAFIQSLVAH